MTQGGEHTARWLQHSGSLIRTQGRLAHLKRPHGGEFELTVDQELIGTITTRIDRFGPRRDRLFTRVTQVLFLDEGEWGIRTEDQVPGYPHERVVAVWSGHPLPEGWRATSTTRLTERGATQIASTKGILSTKRRGAGAVVASGADYELTPVRKARGGEFGISGAIRRDRRGSPGAWSFTTTQPLPLSVPILHWHLLLGDWLVQATGLGG